MKLVTKFCILLLPGLLQADFSTRGYSKSFLLLSDPVAAESSFSFNQRFRFEALAKASDVTFQFAYDIAPALRRVGASTGNTEAFLSNTRLPYRLVDFRRQIYPKTADINRSDFVLFHNLDRFSVQFAFEFVDVTFGRQPIAFGSARSVNPTDVFTAFNYSALDQEERLGIDALRMEFPLGDLALFDLGFVMGKDFAGENSAVFAKLQWNFLSTDLSFLFVSFLSNHLFGIDIQRPFFDAGFWFEGAYVWIPSVEQNANNRNYLRASTGLDYRLGDGLYLFGEYHFNGAGFQTPSLYPNALTKTAFLEGATFLLGKHYFTPGATYQISPLILLTGSLISNLSDASFLLSTTLEYNFAENLYLSFGSFLSLGKQPVSSVAQSEFGSFPSFFFSSLRWYF